MGVPVLVLLTNFETDEKETCLEEEMGGHSK
jgi:hypothetical protein